VHRNEDGSLTFTFDEVYRLRAALFALKHHHDDMTPDLFHTLTGSDLSETTGMLAEIDAAREPDAQRMRREVLQSHLDLYAAMADSGHPERAESDECRAIVAEATELGLPIPARLEGALRRP
jgi:hypothetical protein